MFRGKKRRFTRAHAVAIAALFFALAGSGYAAGPISLLPPSVETVFSGTITPRKLPARGRAPVSLKLAGTIGNPDGSHPPALQELDVELDRHLGLSVEGLPICHPQSGRDQREEFLSKCEEAKVGSGTMRVEVAFPEQVPVQVSGRVSVYSFGVHDGRTMFLLYTYLPAPITGVIATPLEVHRRPQGIFGWKGVLTVPKIANGVGSITFLGFKFHKGIFSAGCPAGKFQQRADSKFANGTEVAVAVVQHCRASD